MANHQHKIISSALLHGEVLNLEQLNLVDTVTPAKTEKERLYSFVISEAKQLANGSPRKDTSGIEPKSIGDSYFEHLESEGYDNKHATEQADKIENVCNKTFKKPKATEVAGALSSGIALDDSWLGEWVILPNDNLFNLKKGGEYGRLWFNSSYAENTPLTSEGKTQAPLNYAKARLNKVDGVAYNPLKEPVYEDEGYLYCNLYREHKHTGKCDRVNARDTIISHIDHLFDCDEEKAFMLDWLAWQVQNKGKLIRYCPLVLGTHGDGKSMIGLILRAAIGNRNVVEINNDLIKDKFNSWANQGAIGVIEEIHVSGSERFAIYDRLKPLITNSHISVNRKFANSLTVPNVTNYIAFTNNNDAVPINEVDRRFYIMETKFKGITFPHEEFRDHFDNVLDCIKNNANGIYRYLDSHEISDKFKSRRAAPMSAAKQRMIDNAMSAGAQAIKERIECLGDSLFIGDGLSTTMLYKKDSAQFVYDLPKNKAMAFAMGELGYIKSTARPRVGDGRHTVYRKR